MFISAKPHRASLIRSSNESCLLVFSCTARDDSGILEIDKDYVFSSEKNRALFSKRRSCELVIRLRRKSYITDKAVESMSISEDKIGNLSFCPARKADDDLGTLAMPGSLDADVYLDDHLFDSLIAALLSNKHPESLQVDIESEEALKYGYEPEGSRMHWKTQATSPISSVNVTRISFVFELMA